MKKTGNKSAESPDKLDKKTGQGFWTKERITQILTLLFVIVIVILIIWQRRNIMAFSQELSHYPTLRFLGFFVISAAASATIIIPVPGLAMTSVFGAFSANPWDPLWFGIVSGLGATLGEMVGYMLGFSGRMALSDTRGYERVVGWMRRWGNMAIFLLALIPNPLFDIAGMAAGILKFPLWKFILVGAAGRLPKHILFSYLGYWGIHILPR